MASPFNTHCLNVLQPIDPIWEVTKSLSGSLFSVDNVQEPGLAFKTSVVQLQPHSLLPSLPSVLSTVFQKSKTLSIMSYILISEMVKCKKVDILESIKYGILYSSKNRTACTVPRMASVSALIFFLFSCLLWKISNIYSSREIKQ